MYTLTENPDGTVDTIVNNSNPEILLHHQRRMIEIDSNFLGKDATFKFDVIGTDTSNRKIFIESANDYRAVIKDTSQEEGKTIVRVSFKDALSYVGERWMLVSKLFSEDAKNGNLRKVGISGRPFEIKTPLFFKINQIPELNVVLKSPVIKTSEKINIFILAFTSNVHPLTLSFFNLVLTNNREVFLEAICRHVLFLYNKIMNIKQGLLVTTKPMDIQTKEKIVSVIAKKLNTKIELQEKYDETLLGGFILRIEDQQIDAIIASKVARLKNELYA